MENAVTLIRKHTQQIKPLFAASLAVAFMVLPCSSIAAPAYEKDAGYKPVEIRGSVSVGTQGADTIESLSLRDTDIKDVLYTLSELGDFNLIIDESVEGTLSVDLKNVPINKVFEYVLTLGELTYHKDGHTFIVTTLEDDEEKNLNKMVLKSIPVKYSNAQDLANVLNETVFSVKRPGGNTNAVANADPRTNSMIIMGNEEDIALAKRSLAELDFPLKHKTYFLKNAPAQSVATAISQTLFGVSLVPGAVNVGGQGAQAGQAGGQAQPGAQAQQAGAAGQVQQAGQAGQAGGQAGQAGGQAGALGGQGGVGGQITAASTNQNTIVNVFKGGPVTFITNPTNNTMTLIGTAEQIELAEGLLYDLDVQPPQVAIEVTVLELTQAKNKAFSPGINSIDPTTGLPQPGQGALQSGELFLNFNGAASTLFYRNGVPKRVGNLFEAISFDFNNNRTRGKVLSNPTVVAVSGSTSNISVTRDIFAGESRTTDPNSGTVVSTPIINSVGITLDITPQVSNNGTVLLNITPTVSAPSGDTAVDSQGVVITLTSTNALTIAEARVKDGETLVLGGLIQESHASAWQKVPFLSDVPLLGAMFRASVTDADNRSELVILVTPHIVKEEGVPYFRQGWKSNVAYDSFYSGVSNEPKPVKYRNPTKLPHVDPPVRRRRNNAHGNAYAGKALKLSGSRKQNLALPTYSEVLK